MHKCCKEEINEIAVSADVACTRLDRLLQLTITVTASVPHRSMMNRVDKYNSNSQ